MSLKDCPDYLADIVGFGHGIIMYGGEAVPEEVAALLDGPVDAKLVGVLGGLCPSHQADERLRDVNVKASRQEVDLLLRRDGLEAGDDGDVDACLATFVDEMEEF